ncbi:MAG: 1-(5-phosphoribosyl)-5-[(5-phosphoribosylamino)methylideneamino]imidazole-4-carboxamide isomerase [Proteobacteria bacterium]|nr:1-(5-phosphoribosyl)-5-[(5-phosphoribosylamino)methylideneamino]imidazole-4-carboxamide isomerase [Deltaproteobacteria bacterium]RZO47356.1 MAG: 1-(5-phosphoribosyl)-5-[(5-phosphoribosylamino)methylideneamino]imidazole-4-carboxamide isomerase [Pseudomonadota bacterium]HAF88731.1 1-(5-phosphoribosyl)-5-[(5-phosphoribosylamino)methylideneamino]imidazole-4-carboxamide isomerase [Deltaproteobacteria bacterium]|tara:strand:- start:413 stop:1132 length:720 start_codon:yes stop_codon:yes gene_type:complete
MLLIPAIDLKDGRCVRLLQGEADAQTIYSNDPVEMAISFEDAGAKRLHLVDLDGAFRGKGANMASIRSILKNISIPVQLGGGLRNAENIEQMFELGVSSVIVSTMAVKNSEVLEEIILRYSGKRIFLGVDSRNRKVSIEGWQEGTEIDDVELALLWKKHGIQRIVFTDIARDGMLSGPNLEALGDFARRTGLKIVASGGVSSMEDLELLKTLEKDGVDQVISGKAIYEGKLNLKEIFKF